MFLEIVYYVFSEGLFPLCMVMRSYFQEPTIAKALDDDDDEF